MEANERERLTALLARLRDLAGDAKGIPEGLSPGARAAIERQLGPQGFTRDVLLGPTGIKALLSDKPGLTPAEGHVVGKLKAALEVDLRAFSPEVATATQKATAASAATKTLLEDPTWLRLVRADPAKAFDLAVGPRRTRELALIKDILGDSGFLPFKDKLTERLLGADTGATFTPELLRRNMARYPKETLAQLYSPKEIVELQQLVSRGQTIEALMNTHGPGQPNHLWVRLLKTEPQRVIEKIVQRDAPHNIDAIERGLGQEGVKLVREKLVESVLRKGEFTPARVWKGLEKYGPVTLNRLFRDDPAALTGMRDFALVERAAASAEKVAESPFSGVGQAISSVNIIRDLFTGRLDVVGKKLMPPYWIAKLYLSEPGRKWLTVGYQLKPIGRNVTKWLAQAAMIAGVQPDPQFAPGATAPASAPPTDK